VSDDVVVALDVGGTGMKCALVRPGGAVHHTERHPTLAARGPEAVTANILDVAAGLADRARAEGLRPVAAGVAVPGVVDEETGTAVWSSNVGFRDVPLRDLVSARLGVPATLGHDVRVGGVAEARLGAGRDERNVLFIAIGTGIAAAHVVDGKAFGGAHGAAGEVGHVIVRPGGPPCGCGARGCLETVIGQEALLRRAGVEVDDAARTAVLAAELLGRAENGDPIVLEVLEDAGAELGRALASVANLLNPEAVVLGGQFALLARWLAPAVEREMRTRVLSSRWAPCQVVASALGGDAAVRGAAALSLRRVLHEPWTVSAPSPPTAGARASRP
jgi:glucokinase